MSDGGSRGRGGAGGASSSFWAQGRGMTLGGRDLSSRPGLVGGEGGGSSIGAAEEGGTLITPAAPKGQAMSDLLFMVLQMLRDTECQESAKILEKEAEKYGLFGETCDWMGKRKMRTSKDLARLAPHVKGQHLLKLIQFATSDSSSSSSLFRRLGSKQSLSTMLSTLLANDPTRRGLNEVALQRASETGVKVPSSASWRPHMYHRIDGRRSIMGHFCPVYCLTYDKTGSQLITGSDDKLVKIWNTRTQQLYRTLRGHVSDIVDLAVSGDNRFLASASNDMDIRIWWLHSGKPVLVLPGHEGLISRITFSSTLNTDLSHSLVSIGLDGTTRVWSIGSAGELLGTHVYSTKDTMEGAVARREVAEVLCCALSPTGLWIATGCSDRMIRIYSTSRRLKYPVKYQGHTGPINHIQFGPNGDKLATGADDGTARVWHIDAQLRLLRQTVLNVQQGEENPARRGGAQSVQIPSVMMVVFSLDGHKVVTSQAFKKSKKDGTLQVRVKVWLADTGTLLHSFSDHKQPVYVLVPHPTDPRIVMSAGYDAQLILWDIETGSRVRMFQISFPYDDRLAAVDFDEQSKEILDGMFHPDGMSMSVSHKNGFITIISSNIPLRVPTEQFFQTDFGELIMDQQRNVIDRQHQVPPHQLAPGLMTDRFGQPLDEQGMVPRQNDAPLLVSPSVARARSRYEEDDVVVVSDGGNDRDFLMETSSSSGSGEEECSDEAVDDDDDDEFTTERRKSKKTRITISQRKERSERVQRRRKLIMESDIDEDGGNSSEVSDSDLLSPRGRRAPAPVSSKPKGPSVVDLKINAKRSREWLTGSEPPKRIDDDYVPQVGDTVVYFHQGHLACLQGGFADESSHFPLDDFPSMRSSEHCKVRSVKYQMPAPNEDEEQSVYCVLLLQLLPEGRVQEGRKMGDAFHEGDRVRARWKGKYRFPGVVTACNGDNTYAIQYDDGDFERKQHASTMEYQTFSVSYRRTHLAEFIIPIYRYGRNIGKEPYVAGDRFQMWFAGATSQTYKGTIRSVRPVDSKHSDSEWQRLAVEWDEADGNDEYEGLERLSHWEIFPDDDTTSSQSPALMSTLTDDEANRLASGLKTIITSSVAAPFSRPVETHIYTDYLSFVPVPMDLSTILKRLERKYYRSAEAVQSDCDLVIRNARIFNKVGSNEFVLANKLAPILTRLVSGEDWMAALSNDDVKDAIVNNNSADKADDEIERDPHQTWQTRASRALQKFHKFNGTRVVQLVRVPAQLSSSIIFQVREFLLSDKYRGILYPSLRESLDGGLYKSFRHFAFEFLIMCCNSILVNPRGGSKGYKQGIKMIQDALSVIHSIRKVKSSVEGKADDAPEDMSEARNDASTQLPLPSVSTDATNGLETRNMEVDGGSTDTPMQKVKGEAVKDSCEASAAPCDGSGQNATIERVTSHVKEEGADDVEMDDAGHVKQLSALLACLSQLDKDDIFQMPVPVESYPDYCNFVLSPMDFSTIAEKNRQGLYTSAVEMGLDFLLICANAIIFNHHSMHVHQKAVELLVGGLQILYEKITPVASCEKVDARAHTVDDGKGKAIQKPPKSDGEKWKETADVGKGNATKQGESSKGAAGGSTQELECARARTGSSKSGSYSEDVKETRAFVTKMLGKLRACDKSGLFWEPVTPEIAADYDDVIPHPMDILTMAKKNSSGEYDRHPQIFVRDVLLMSTNALVYNTLGDEICQKALEVAKKGLDACSDKLVEWNTRLLSKMDHSSENRPAGELKRWLQQISLLDRNQFFNEPVTGIPEYGAVIKVPMDLQTMKARLEAGMYPEATLFQLDAFLIVIDCCIFNKADTPWHQAAVALAKSLLQVFFLKSGGKNRSSSAQEAVAKTSKKIATSSMTTEAPSSKSARPVLTSGDEDDNDDLGSGFRARARGSRKRKRTTVVEEEDESEEDGGSAPGPSRSRRRGKLDDDDGEDEPVRQKKEMSRRSRGTSRVKDEEEEENFIPKRSGGRRISSRGGRSQARIDDDDEEEDDDEDEDEEVDYVPKTRTTGRGRLSKGGGLRSRRSADKSDEDEDQDDGEDGSDDEGEWKGSDSEDEGRSKRSKSSSRRRS